MKKEYVILIVLIIGLGAYLGLKKDDRVHYELPVPATVDTGKTDRLEIKKGNLAIVLNKEEKGWTLTEKAFPADESAVGNLLDTVKKIKLSALVSEASDLVRYELDPDNAIVVKAFAGKDEQRAFTIGKTAPSFNHTFIMLGNDKRIFQADKSFRNNFDKSVDEFRDKLVLEFKPGEIKKITLEKQGKTVTLTAVKSKKESPEKDTTGDKTPETTWRFDDGSIADQTVAKDLLSSLSHLECQSYLNEPEAAQIKKLTALCKITLKREEALSLNLFEQDGKESMAGTASSSPYAFSLASYKAGDIVSYVDKLLGLEKPEKSGSVTE